MKGYSLHIGLDKVGSNYSSLEDLNGAVLDAKNMHFLARKNGFQMIPFKSPDLAPLDSVLLNEMATRENILDGIYQAAKTLEPKDFFFLTFSGHGGRKTDASGDERIDQTWCLFDYQFLDDELHNLMAQFERGVRILVLSDSCYSGSILEFLDFFKGRS
ncbi:MAG: caspase family protein, partial [Cyclobacteriaceae bacterium]